MLHQKLLEIRTQALKILLDKEREITLALIGILSGGHILIEDTPGMGKTTLVYLLGKLLGMEINRIQFTNDMLPSDIIGTSIYDKKEGVFNFKKGPLFGQLILADELNRATPKTQSALLQSMEENCVSVDGQEYSMDENFLIMATQNPFQQIGTYRLPESQIDRFFMGFSLGFPERRYEKEMIRREKGREVIKEVGPLVAGEELKQWRRKVCQVSLSEAILDYIVDLLERGREEFEEGILLSPRAGRDLARASKAYAFMNNRDYVIPEDVQFTASAVLGHRLGASQGVRQGHQRVWQIIEQVPVR